MKRLYSKRDFKFYTYLKQVLFDLGLADKDYLWLISDIEAYPREKEHQALLNREYLLLTTKELLDLLEAEDFQWIWAVFSGIPSRYQKEDILQFDLPCVETIEPGKYNPHTDKPQFQHPYAEFEIYAVDSSYMFLISDREALLRAFREKYPEYEEK